MLKIMHALLKGSRLVRRCFRINKLEGLGEVPHLFCAGEIPGEIFVLKLEAEQTWEVP